MISQVLRSSLAVRPFIVRSSKTIIAPTSRSYSSDFDRFDKSLYPRPELAPPTYDDYPLPKGDWKEDYDKHQRKFNLQLAGGFALFSVALYTILTTDAIDWGGPPKGVIGVNPPYFSAYPKDWPAEKRIP